MHIARVAIQNFRNFSSIDVDDLSPGLVLVGENGSGKSNFLDALRLVLDPSLAEDSRQLSAEDFWDGLASPFAGSEIEVVVELAGFDDNKAAKSVLGEFLVASSPHRARLTFVYRPVTTTEDSGASSEGDYEVLVFGGIDESRRVGRSEWRFVSLRVLPALRDAETSLRSPRSPLRRLINRSNVDPGVLADVASQIDVAATALTDSGELSSVSAAISDRLEAMVGGMFAVPTSLGVLSTKPEQLLRSMRLFIDSERRRGIEQASLGTANLLYLTLLLEDISAQQAADEIVELMLAVEEPEAHLHPHVQRVLFRHLLQEDRALVVTTHSPHIASVTPLASLLLLRESEGSSSAYRADTAALTVNETADIERYLDVTRAEILFARTVILVEGLTELYLVPAFAREAGMDLDAHGITVCSVHGTDFAPYVRLLGKEALDIPVVVITDGDPNKDGKPVGLTRARDLMANGGEADLSKALASQDYDLARKLCAAAGIMVGGRTLEIDLIPTATDAMCDAYDELTSSEVKRERFRNEIARADDNGEQRAKLLKRIEAVGKGRYAQRLAAHLSGIAPPPHITAALKQIQKIIAEESQDRKD